LDPVVQRTHSADPEPTEAVDADGGRSLGESITLEDRLARAIEEEGNVAMERGSSGDAEAKATPEPLGDHGVDEHVRDRMRQSERSGNRLARVGPFRPF